MTCPTSPAPGVIGSFQPPAMRVSKNRANRLDFEVMGIGLC